MLKSDCAWRHGATIQRNMHIDRPQRTRFMNAVLSGLRRQRFSTTHWFPTETAALFFRSIGDPVTVITVVLQV
jgi:hypothetical protein